MDKAIYIVVNYEYNDYKEYQDDYEMEEWDSCSPTTHAYTDIESAYHKARYLAKQEASCCARPYELVGTDPKNAKLAETLPEVGVHFTEDDTISVWAVVEMNLDDISKILNESKTKRCEETEALRKLSDVDFCDKMVSFLETELDETQKEVSHGDGDSFYNYYEIEESFEDVFDVGAALLYFKALFYYEILNFCACGNTQLMLNGVILPLLEAFNDGPYENFDRNYGKNTGMSEAMVEFFLHYLDERGLTNHGSSVWGSWLEESGRLWREVLRRTEEIEV